MIEKTHSVAQRTRALITPIAMRILLLVIILGSIAVYLLPDLPGDAHLGLQSLWLFGVWLVLNWQLVRLLTNPYYFRRSLCHCITCCCTLTHSSPAPT